ncbi:glutathione reductase [Streptococcus gallolyticus]|uniref:Glutathione reductase n=1 Tax=Streptococcus gallolyticus TaxID=315405 RepID=A0AA94S9S5_9STRE|nr:NAD(P)/FAD-dependent oxidoreductase [Streptococcus gallolyticus]AQP41306.1 glutathione reductase [Streptococcus gallolyticus subsp. gallolyticus DSM 16831]SQG78588.1 glutathione reductase [Streptococcus gallolyticus]
MTNSEKKTKAFDFLVIGGGITGLTVSSNLAIEGKKVALIESRDWGGTSINRGATAKKAILALSELHHKIEAFHGKGFDSIPDINWEDMISHRDWLVEDQRARAKERAISSGVYTFEGQARFLDDHHVIVDGQVLSADTIVIATGSKPRELTFEGAQFVDDSGNLLRQHRKPKEIAIIGAGVIALSLISSFTEAGVKVHVIQHNKGVLRGFDRELVDTLVTRLQSKGAEFHLNAEPIRVCKEDNGFYSVLLSTGTSLIVNGIYDAAGRVPYIQQLDLEKAGISYNSKGIKVNDYLQTSKKWIYALGDCCDTPVPKLTSYGDYQAKYLANLLFGHRNDKISYPKAPAVTVFSIPKLGQVGIPVSQAKTSPNHYNIKDIDMSHWQNYRRVRDDLAQLKLVIDTSNQQVVGAEILSDTADILINYLALLINLGASMQDVQNIIFAYPSIATDLYGIWT